MMVDKREIFKCVFCYIPDDEAGVGTRRSLTVRQHLQMLLKVFRLPRFTLKYERLY